MEIFRKEEIKKLIPHRGRMLLLDEVYYIPETERILGELLITKDLCEGPLQAGEMIFRLSDILDMAGQLLGVWVSLQNFNLSGKVNLVREYGRAVSKGKVSPEDLLVIELAFKNIDVIPVGKKYLKVRGRDFSIRVNGQNGKRKISLVELIVA